MILPKRISLSAPKGAGKDTLARYLIEQEGYEISSMSKKLKDICSIVFGWDREMLEALTDETRALRQTPELWWEKKLDWENRIGKKTGMRFTPEVSLQYVGTELFRDVIHEDIWIAAMERDLHPDGKYITKDTRFENEFDRLGDMGYARYEMKRGEDTAIYLCAKNRRQYYKDYGDEKGRIEGFTANDAIIRLAKLQNVHISEIAWVGLPFEKVIYNNGSIEDTAAQLYI